MIIIIVIIIIIIIINTNNTNLYSYQKGGEYHIGILCRPSSSIEIHSYFSHPIILSLLGIGYNTCFRPYYD